MKMVKRQAEYLLSQAPNEIDRLQSWARSWEPETEAMLDEIHVQPGWRCLDLACGPLGIIRPLSQRVGLTGQVVGADINPAMLAAARSFAEENELKNVDFVETNSYQSDSPNHSTWFMLDSCLPLGR
jgi:ubiquinone/menaquinone biosynthesis C-methylase UbiE